MNFLSQFHSITQGAIPKTQTLRKEMPLNNILVPYLAWVNNKDVKIIIFKKSSQETHDKKVSKIYLYLSAFIALELYQVNLNFYNYRTSFRNARKKLNHGTDQQH